MFSLNPSIWTSTDLSLPPKVGAIPILTTPLCALFVGGYHMDPEAELSPELLQILGGAFLAPAEGEVVANADLGGYGPYLLLDKLPRVPRSELLCEARHYHVVDAEGLDYPGLILRVGYKGRALMRRDDLQGMGLEGIDDRAGAEGGRPPTALPYYPLM